jgi:O-antigen/teichoic acid export membrane protein
MEFSEFDLKVPDDNLPKTTSIRQVVKNSFFNLGAWGANILISLVTTPFIVLKLTDEGYGVFALLTGLVGYYSLLDLGLGQGVTKFVAEYKAKGDNDGINQAINAAIWIQLILGLVASTLLVVYADPILTLLRVSPQYWTDAKVSLYAAALGFFFTMIAGTLSSALMGLQRYDITSTVGAVTSAALNILIVIALYIGFGLRQAMYLTLLSGLMLLIFYFFYLRRHLPTWRLPVLPDRPHLVSLFRYSIYMFISKISSIFSNYIVRFVVGFFLGPASVTYYVVTSRLVNTMSSLLYNAVTVLFPFASEVGTRGEQAQVNRLYIESSRLLAAFAFPLLLLTTVFAKPILSIWMGPEFAEKSWMVLSILSLVGLINTLSTVPNLLAMGLGHSRIIGLFSVITLLFYIILLPPLTQWAGVTGTAAAMLAATFPGILLIIYLTRKIFNMKLMDYLIKTMRFHLLPVLASFVIWLSIRNASYPSKIKSLIFPILFIVCYFCIMALVNWLPINGMIKRIQHRLTV